MCPCPCWAPSPLSKLHQLSSPQQLLGPPGASSCCFRPILSCRWTQKTHVCWFYFPQLTLVDLRSHQIPYQNISSGPVQLCPYPALLYLTHPMLSFNTAALNTDWQLISLTYRDAVSVQFGQRQCGSSSVSLEMQAPSFFSTTLVHGHQH